MTLVEALTKRYGTLPTGPPYPVEVPGASRLHLASVFSDMGFTKGAEIGVWAGEYSEYLCQGMPGLDLTCVDPWVAYQDYSDHRNRAHIAQTHAEAMARLAPYRCRIIRAFSDISQAGVGDISIVIAGIAEALVCTATGLWVAIPAVIAYNFFMKAIDRFAAEMDLCASETLEILHPGRRW